MLRAFSTSATGMLAQQTMVDVIANNIANINTNGFKQSRVDFQDLLYIKMKEFGTETAAGVTAPNGLEVGSGVRVVGTMKNFSNGELVNTGGKLDAAIGGEGFFKVTLPGGETQYTRDGSFRLNADGALVTATGYTVEPAITISSDAISVDIGQDGTVNITTPSGTSSGGTIELVRFPNPGGLSSEGGNLFAETVASGTPSSGTAGQNGFGILQAGFVEKSNVQMINELVGLITSQRAYEVNSRAIRAGDEMLRKAIQMARF